MNHRYYIHALSDEHARKLSEMGWQCAERAITHHNAHSVAYFWEGEGQPPLPEFPFRDEVGGEK